MAKSGTWREWSFGTPAPVCHDGLEKNMLAPPPEAEGVAFKPQGPGRASVGVRMNKVNYFHGAVAKARFTPSALPVSAFMTLPK